jgi:mutator protein MutT
VNRAEYLLARGWLPSDVVVDGAGHPMWIDPLRDTKGFAHAAYCPEEGAERRQLDRDAAARDYLEARRPGVTQVVMAAVFQLPDISNGGKVLLGKRAAGYEFPGQWCLPGGKVEHGEDLEAALFRELREEVGVEFGPRDVLAGALVYHFDPPVTKRRVRIYCFELGHREGLTYAPLDGLDAVQWFAPEEVGALAVTPATREALRWWASPPFHVQGRRG